MRKLVMTTVSVFIFGLLLSTFFLLPALAQKAPEFIKIGCTLPLTGRFGGGGIEVKVGYEVGVDHINQAGGIFIKEFGKKIPVKLTILDDESDPAKAVSRYERLYKEDNVDAYLGPYTTVIATPVVAVAEKNKVPIVVGFFATMKPFQQGYKYLFSPYMKTPDYLSIIEALTEISGNDRPKNLAIVVSKTEWPMDIAQAWREKIAKDGIYRVVVDETYPLGSMDFSMIISKAKAANAQAWLGAPSAPEGMAMTRQMKELDYRPTFMNMSMATDDREWPGGEGQIGEYAGSLEGWIGGLKWPGNDRFYEDAKKKIVGKLPTSGNLGSGYMQVQVLADAIERAGSLDKEKIREALTKSNMMTIGGPVKARPNGTFEVPLYWCQWHKGEFDCVWPKKNATANPVYPIPKWK